MREARQVGRIFVVRFGEGRVLADRIRKQEQQYKKFSVAILIFAFATFFPSLASAQWDYGQDSTWNIIENRIDIRKARARMKARQKAKSKKGRATSKKKTAAVRKTSAPVKKAALPSHVEFYRDTFQDFHLDDSKGYVVNFVFTSTTGKVIRKSHTFTYYNSVTDFKDLPVGKYRVTAEAVYGGKKYPVHLASEDGEVGNPKGGNFAPSMNIEIKLGKDQWGSDRLLTLPDSLHVRVIE